MDDRRFDLTDAVAHVGIRDFRSALKNLPDDAWVLGCANDARILLGSVGASQSVVRGDAYQARLDILLDAINTFAGTIPGVSGPAATLGLAITAFKAAWPAMLSTKVKVD